ncbi:MAG TPA: hypothetical protein VFH43_04350 [Candidatus Kapabacteria bacterium]|nr:hypothetical protein [Candidatus Kapabacteria bacterium]
MLKCFFNTCLLVVTVLMLGTGVLRAQSNFSVSPQVYIDSVYLGSSIRDTFLINDFKFSRTIFPVVARQSARFTLALDEAQLYPRLVSGIDTVRQGFTITPVSAGWDSIYLAIRDSQGFGDTLIMYIHVLNTPRPFTVDHQLDLGPLIVGASIPDSFYVKNVGQTVKIAPFFAANDFRSQQSITVLSPGIPQVVPAGDSLKVRILIHNDSIGQQKFALHFLDSFSSHVETAEITLTGIPATPADSVFELRHGGKDVFARIVSSDTASFAVIARNVTDSVYAIQQIINDNASHFRIESALPIIVDPQEAFDLIIRSTTEEEGFYPTLVRLPSNGGLASEYSITIQVLRVASMSVPPMHSKSGSRIVQTPTSIAIEGLSYDRGSVEVFDVLGRKLAQHEHVGPQIFFPKIDESGERLKDGAYFLRLFADDGSSSETLKVIFVGY